MSILNQDVWSDLDPDDRIAFTKEERHVRDLAIAHKLGHARAERDFRRTLAAAPVRWRPYLSAAWEEELAE